MQNNVLNIFEMKIFIFLLMCIGQALSDSNASTLKALEQKAFDDLVMKIMHDESIFYSFMQRSAISGVPLIEF